MTPSDSETTQLPISICYVSGVESLSHSDESQHYCFTEKEVRNLADRAQKKYPQGVDLLLTSAWPAGISNYIHNKEDLEKYISKGSNSELISFVAAAVQPRYHFTALHEAYYERLPYRNHIILREKAKHVTRFISLSSVGNEEKS